MENNTPLLINVFQMKNFNCEFPYTWAHNDPVGSFIKEMTPRHNTVFHSEAKGWNETSLLPLMLHLVFSVIGKG